VTGRGSIGVYVYYYKPAGTEERDVKEQLTIGLAFIVATTAASADIFPEEQGTNPASITVRFESSAEATCMLVYERAQP
jgi:hypothetical protein